MNSLLTNSSAAAALRNLAGTERSLTATGQQISTGLRVASASDDAAYWAISVGMRSRLTSVGAVQDGLRLVDSIAKVADAALSSITATVQSIRNDLIAAQQPGTDRTALQQSIAAKQQSIVETANAASFNGQNWLVGQSSLDTSTSDTRHFQSTFANVGNVTSGSGGTPFNEDVTLVSTQTGTDDLGSVSTNTSTTSGFWSFASNGVTTPSFSTSTAVSSTSSSDTKLLLPGSVSNGAGLQFIALQKNQFYLFDQISGTNSSTFDADYTDGHATHGASSSSTGFYDSFDAATQTNRNALDRAILTSSGSTSILSLSIASASDADLTSMVAGAETALSALVANQAALGSFRGQIALQTSFNDSLSDALASGIGSLVDANMDLASTRLRALQTQRQLGIEALSIANDNGAMVLKLFGS
ncbi:flagellin [Lichenifustis flavocetrariae]|uniref:Flagellin n=1 Tax=Lichenifustis flavocetrariae TaxID=2949735 RepID=A0AA41Z098_9HYPH|nr:flagellin [Lichenifustis flavocetrariae]MCW6511394.1 flagellin [Lichenifustis flavocetrariae]